MTVKDALTEARSDMLAVLDEKLANMPEWKAFRAMDKAIAAMSATPSSEANRDRPAAILRRGRTPDVPSYVDLALEAITTKGFPLSTTDIVEFIGQKRPISSDGEKARINIQSGLSRNKRIKSIPWHGGRAWWFPDRKPPHKENRRGLEWSSDPAEAIPVASGRDPLPPAARGQEP